MKCGEAIREMLRGGEIRPAAAEHLRDCPRCRGLAGVADRLRAAGQIERSRDLSAPAVARTLRRAAGAMEAPRARRFAIPFPVAAGLAAACAALLALVGPVMLRTGQPGGRRAEPAGAGREAVAAADPWESDLRNQRLRVNDAFRRFSRAHLAQEGTDWPGARTSDLRGRIELCAFQAGRDSWQAAR